ncbi:hypothetical protein E4U57_001368 [Claviceps arundinis]|uniref:Threonine/serine exporter-like N-terminal domain-containing protein n=1 Tax=Claviceps arundinis TaxID=1623583 RepID=A0A9P7STD9_9HYPO|nr:hypothetical protein E4U57_001368 [Claviceps arundinis]KAG5976109.1 hypothetical protein E4U56_002451 [Claviceps arundinis]
MYGAPTHRLEEYMSMSSRALEIEGQFFYIPDCMTISFDESKAHSSEVELVRVLQGIDLRKLQDAHDINMDVAQCSRQAWCQRSNTEARCGTRQEDRVPGMVPGIDLRPRVGFFTVNLSGMGRAVVGTDRHAAGDEEKLTFDLEDS